MTGPIGKAPLTNKPKVTQAPVVKKAVVKKAAPPPPPARTAGLESSFKASGAVQKARTQKLAELDKKLTASGVPDAQKKAVLERLKGLQPKNFDRELATLDHALKSPNADRAVKTWKEVGDLAVSSPEAAARLTPEIRDSMVKGVADPRSAHHTAKEGILGPKQALEAATALSKMPKAQYDAAAEILTKAGVAPGASPRADAQAEKATLLKAIAARKDRLMPSESDDAAVKSGQAKTTEAERAMREVTGFAQEVRGMDRSDLINSTSPLDLDAKNTSAINPQAVHDGADGAGDNDGVYQKWSQSCGPTIGQIVKGEADPVFARELRKSPEAQNQGQKDLMAKQGATDVRSVAAHKAIHRATELAKGRGYSQEKWDSMDRYIKGQSTGWFDEVRGKMALKELQAVDGGHPNAGELKDYREGGAGIKQTNLEPVLKDVATPITGVDYQSQQVPRDGSGRRPIGDEQLTKVDERLKNGQDIPLRMEDGSGKTGHFIVLTDVRGSGADKAYLIADPWTGKTGWVKADDLKKDSAADPANSWQKKQFGLDQTNVSHFYMQD